MFEYKISMRIILFLTLLSFIFNIKAQNSNIEVEIQLGHTDFITNTAFSPDNKYLVSGGIDKIIIYNFLMKRGCIFNS